MRIRASRLWAVTLVAGALLPAALTAAPAEPARADLDRVVSIKIERQPLSVAVEMLRERTKLNLILDALTIQQQLGFDPAQPPTAVDLDLKNVKVRDALRAVLAPYNLVAAPVGDAVVVTTEEAATARQMGQRVSVDLDKVELEAALKQLARENGVNLQLDPRVAKQAKATVSLQLDDVPLETAVRLLSEMAGLKPARVGNTLFVTAKATAGEMRGDGTAAQPEGRAQKEYLLRLRLMTQLGQMNGAPPLTPLPATEPVKVTNPDVPPTTPAPEKKDDK